MTVPEVFVKLNSSQIPPRFQSGKWLRLLRHWAFLLSVDPKPGRAIDLAYYWRTS